MSVVLKNEESFPKGKGKEYLCYFVHRLLEFRCPEVESLLRMAGYSKDDIMWRLPAGNLEMSPCWYVNLPNESVAKSISNRCLLTKAFVEIWGEGSSVEELKESIMSCDPSIKDPWFGEDVVFRVCVEGFGISLSMEEQLKFITALNFLPFKGKVSLKNPNVIFHLIVSDCRSNDSLIDGDMPYRIYFGRQISTNDRHIIDSYALRRRAYIGPTSMDCEMSFLMCNQALVRKGHSVFDPYAGTGSILVAAAVRGAHVWGADLDLKILRDGKTSADGKNLTLHSNFEQYGLPQPVALLRMDAHTSPFRPGMEEIFDAIIGDPPYGVRAGGRKCGSAATGAMLSSDYVFDGRRAQGPGPEGGAEGGEEAPTIGGVSERLKRQKRAGEGEEAKEGEKGGGDSQDGQDGHRVEDTDEKQGLGKSNSSDGGHDPSNPNPDPQGSDSDSDPAKAAPFIPLSALKPYLLGECMRDLLELSARLLTVGGRLVYFLPCTPETYHEKGVPSHPALQVVANSEQVLTSRYSRRLVTMEKVRPYDAAAAAAFYEANPDPTMAIDSIRDIVYETVDPNSAEAESTKQALALNQRRLRCKAF